MNIHRYCRWIDQKIKENWVIFIRVCIRVYLQTVFQHTHVQPYTFTLTHTRTHAHAHIQTHKHKQTHTHTFTLTHTHTHVTKRMVVSGMTHSHTHTHKHKYIYTNTHAHTPMQVTATYGVSGKIHTYTHTHTQTREHTHANTHKHTHTYTHTHTHTHTHKHTHTHTHAISPSLSHTHTPAGNRDIFSKWHDRSGRGRRRSSAPSTAGLFLFFPTIFLFVFFIFSPFFNGGTRHRMQEVLSSMVSIFLQLFFFGILFVWKWEAKRGRIMNLRIRRWLILQSEIIEIFFACANVFCVIIWWYCDPRTVNHVYSLNYYFRFCIHPLQHTATHTATYAATHTTTNTATHTATHLLSLSNAKSAMSIHCWCSLW